MAQADEVSDRGGDAPGIVDDDGKVVRAPRTAVHEHEWEVIAAQLRDGRVGHEARRDEETVDLPFAEHAQVGRLALRGILGVTEDQVVAAGMRGVLDAFDDRREERVVDVRHEHAERERAPKAQAPRERGRAIAEPICRRDDALAGLRQEAELGPRVQHPRDRGRMHARRARDIDDRDARLGHVVYCFGARLA